MSFQPSKRIAALSVSYGIAIALLFPLTPLTAAAQDSIPALLTTPFSQGADDCGKAHLAPLEVRRYDANTYVFRESLCATTEAPFMYLIVGQTRALLIDTGDVEDSVHMPLAQTVFGLLTGSAGTRLPLLVVHTHRHLDHRLGDSQFKNQADVDVVGFDLDSVKAFYGFKDWPNGTAQIDLGDRIVDVMPAPGHNETHVVFYDRTTALLFTGDFLMPARLLINDKAADLASARRVADFAATHPVSYVLGGHVEVDANGKTFSWGSTLHANEHVLQLTREDVLGLPEAVEHFNHFYTHFGKYIMQDQLFVLPFFTMADPAGQLGINRVDAAG